MSGRSCSPSTAATPRPTSRCVREDGALLALVRGRQQLAAPHRARRLRRRCSSELHGDALARAGLDGDGRVADVGHAAAGRARPPARGGASCTPRSTRAAGRERMTRRQRHVRACCAPAPSAAGASRVVCGAGHQLRRRRARRPPRALPGARRDQRRLGRRLRRRPRRRCRAAARSEDGRGPRTRARARRAGALRPRDAAASSPRRSTSAASPQRRIVELPPLVFDAARGRRRGRRRSSTGSPTEVARARCASRCERLELDGEPGRGAARRRHVPEPPTGGCSAAIEAGPARPAASRCAWPRRAPIVGAALLGLDELGARRRRRRTRARRELRRRRWRRSMAEVRFEQATRDLPGTDVPAVDALDLDIADGELMVLVGPSGSGKTTALRMLAGLEEVDAGAICIGDRDVTDDPPKHRDVAMVFQNYALYPYLDVAANIAFPLRMARVPKAEREERVREVAEHARADAATSSASPASSPAASASAWRWGARSCASRSVFLMDEPLSNLDAKLRVQMRADIAALQERLGVTTVYVTHDQAEAMTLGPPRRRAARRAAAAVRHAARAVRPPGEHVRGRLRRLAGDEPLPRADGARRRVRVRRAAARARRRRAPNGRDGGDRRRAAGGARARGRRASTPASRWSRSSAPTRSSSAAPSWPAARRG